MYYNCEWDGPEHHHSTPAEAEACITDFYAATEIEIRRWDNPALDVFFRDSDHDHFVIWSAER